LSVSKEEIQKYSQHWGLEWREDITNQDVTIERNRIRKNMKSGLLPADHLDLRSAQNICQVATEIWDKINLQISSCITEPSKGLFQISIEDYRKIQSFGPDLSYEILSVLAECQGVKLRRSGFREFAKQLKQHSERVKIQINKDYHFIFDEMGIKLVPQHTILNFEKNRYQPLIIDLKAKFTKFTGNWMGHPIEVSVKRYLKETGFVPIIKVGNRVTLDGGLFSSKLIIRKRNKGDKFSPLGSGSRNNKLKKYLIDKKFTNLQKDSQMLVCNHNDVIVWLPKVEISDFVKVTSKTSEIIEVEIKC